MNFGEKLVLYIFIIFLGFLSEISIIVLVALVEDKMVIHYMFCPRFFFSIDDHLFLSSHTNAIMELALHVGYFVKKNIHVAINAN